VQMARCCSWFPSGASPCALGWTSFADLTPQTRIHERGLHMSCFLQMRKSALLRPVEDGALVGCATRAIFAKLGIQHFDFNQTWFSSWGICFPRDILSKVMMSESWVRHPTVC
jgi:hypothetical protein